MTALSFALNSSFSDTVLERMVYLIIYLKKQKKFYNTNTDSTKIA